jgi:predicted nucleic acid-binding protein
LKLVLDTNIYSDYAEGLADVVETIAQYGRFLFLPSIVLGELTYGFLKGKRQTYNESKLRQFIHRLKVEIITADADVARKYGFIFLSLEKRGVKIPINDVWIAACCMEVGGVLLTRDRHFEHIEQIETMILPST